ncbi:MAG: ABC transporter family substrate-binding protein [Actinomycetota bacterium]
MARNAVVAVAIAGATALVLAGCTTAGTPTPTAAKGGTVTVATVNDFTSFNTNTPDGNLDTNGFVSYMTIGGFFYVDPKFKVIYDTSFGKLEKTSDSPLTVKYTLKKGLKWSDGKPITADDMALAWAINTGFYDSGTTDDNGKVTSGTNYFSTAGSTVALNGPSFPAISSDNLTMTMKYSEPYVDYAIFSPIAQPAHVVAEKAGLKSAAELTALLKKLPKGDPAKPAAADPTLQKAADFVNTGYDVTAMPTDKSLLVSSGPMVVSDFVPTQSLTLVKNKFYTGDHVSKVDKIVIRNVPDANAQVSALANGEVDVINPQASADTLTALKATSAKVIVGSQAAYDHLDLSFNAPVFQDLKVRQAFLKTIPRQQILDAIVTPIDPKAKVLNSQQFLPQVSAYAESVKGNGSSAYDKVDIEGAKALLAGATPTVKLMYNTKNPNRVDEFQAIQASATKAGFKIVDAGSPDWSKKLGDGTYDAVMFGWVNPGYGYAGVPQIWSTNGGGNYNAYKGTDKLALSTQSILDAKKIVPILQKMDKQAFTDAYGLPLFQSPGIIGVANRVTGVDTYFAGQTGPFWNFWEWTVKGK